jgi:2-polyprenyl-3-methyl-5-hydroxy-6-metoxy-1,4-benzoquinol methylase
MEQKSAKARVVSRDARSARRIALNSPANGNFAIASSSQNVTLATDPMRASKASRARGVGDVFMTELIQAQKAFWNSWNAAHREQHLSQVSLDQRDLVLRWLSGCIRRDLDIIEVGCGAGWLCPSLKAFGKVTATDLSDEVLSRAAQRVPDVAFIPGDFLELELPDESYDVVVTLEVLAHVGDQEAFVAKLARLLRPGGTLILATQNRPAMERYNRVKPVECGQLRRWVDRKELHALLSRHLTVRDIVPITPYSNRGVTRLVAGSAARRVMRMSPGRFLERALAPEFGRTLMALAQKPVRAAE